MPTDEIPGYDDDVTAAVAAVWNARDSKLLTLVKAGGLDPRTDFRHCDLRGWPLAGEDVRGIDFTGSDMRMTGIFSALRDETTILDNIIFDSTDEEADFVLADNPGVIELSGHPDIKLSMKNLLNDAKEDARKQNFVSASIKARHAYELASDLPDNELIPVANFAVRASIAFGKYQSFCGIHEQHEITAAEVSDLLERVVKQIPTNERASDSLVKIANIEMADRYARGQMDTLIYFISLALRQIMDMNKQLNVENAQKQYDLLDAAVSAYLRKPDLHAARAAAREMVKLAHDLQALNRKTLEWSLLLRANVKLAQITKIDAFGRFDDEAVEILRQTVEDHIHHAMFQPPKNIDILLSAGSDLLRWVHHRKRDNQRFPAWLQHIIERLIECAKVTTSRKGLHKFASALAQSANVESASGNIVAARKFSQEECEVRRSAVDRSNSDQSITRFLVALERLTAIAGIESPFLELRSLEVLVQQLRTLAHQDPRNSRRRENVRRCLKLLAKVLAAKGDIEAAEEALSEASLMAQFEPQSHD
jgi:hypothetical protein